MCIFIYDIPTVFLNILLICTVPGYCTSVRIWSKFDCCDCCVFLFFYMRNSLMNIVFFLQEECRRFLSCFCFTFYRTCIVLFAFCFLCFRLFGWRMTYCTEYHSITGIILYPVILRYYGTVVLPYSCTLYHTAMIHRTSYPDMIVS